MNWINILISLDVFLGFMTVVSGFIWLVQEVKDYEVTTKKLFLIGYLVFSLLTSLLAGLR